MKVHRALLTATAVVALTAAQPASATSRHELDGVHRRTLPISGQLTAVPGASPLNVAGLADACDPKNCVALDLRLTAPRGKKTGRFTASVGTDLTNAGVGLRLYDAAGHLVDAGDGGAIGGTPDPGGQRQGASLLIAALPTGDYQLRVRAYGGQTSYAGRADWRP